MVFGEEKNALLCTCKLLEVLENESDIWIVVTRTEGTYLGYRDNSFLPPLDMLGYPFMTLNLVLRWGG